MEAMSKTFSEVSVHSQKKVIPKPVEIVQTVVPLQKIDKVASTISAVPTVHVVPVAVNKDVVDDVVPLSGLNVQLKRVRDDTCVPADRRQRWNLFQAQCMIKGKAWKLMIDGGSCTNGISKAMVAALGLSTWRIPEPKHLEWLNSCGMLKVTHKVRVPFTVGDYVDEVECDVLPLEVCGLLLGRPWQYDRNAIHAGHANTYSFMHDGKHMTLKPMGDDLVKSDVVLVVRKEKLHKAKPQPSLAKLQPEELDAKSVSTETDSAMPVDDKPVVLVSDKPVEVKPLIGEKKEIAACDTPSVCVDKGVQTDDGDVRDSVHMATRFDDRYFVRTPLPRFVGVVVRMHKGKDGRVRQLCGPGITTLQGRPKKVHVPQQRAPSSVEKKKVVAPKSKLIWRRKEAHSVVSSQAATMCDAVDITPTFQRDLTRWGQRFLKGGRMIWARRGHDGGVEVQVRGEEDKQKNFGRPTQFGRPTLMVKTMLEPLHRLCKNDGRPLKFGRPT